MVADMAPGGEHQRLGEMLEVGDYIAVSALAVDIAVPERVMVLAVPRAYERQTFIGIIVELFERQTFVNGVECTVVETLLGIFLLFELPSEIRIYGPYVGTVATGAAAEYGRSHVVGDNAERHGAARDLGSNIVGFCQIGYFRITRGFELRACAECEIHGCEKQSGAIC